MRIGLIGCVKTKRDEPSAARDLYVSPLFLGRRAHVERTCDEWYILSAKHGLVHPDTVIEPYDIALTASSSRERQEWARTVIRQLRDHIGDLASHEYEVHAGAAYRDFGLVERLLDAGAKVEVPAEGLSQGEQLAFYAHGTRPIVLASPSLAGLPADPKALPARRRGRAGGKYAPLGEYLEAMDEAVVSLSFTRIEEVLGAPLPASAHKYREWWANTDRSPHARSWLQAGYRVDGVDVVASTIRFRRDRRPAPEPGPQAPELPSETIAISEIRKLEPFTFRWPGSEEQFSRGWAYVVDTDARQYRIRHGLGSRQVFGSQRVHSVTWVDGAPQVEAAGADDHARTRDLIGLIKRVDGRDARSEDQLPPGYEASSVVVHREAVDGPWARRSLAIRVREDDLEGWARHALIQADLRQQRTRPGPVRPPAPAPTVSEAPAKVTSVVAALLAHSVAMAEGGPANFATDPEADDFLRRDPFAFLVAVVFDQSIVAERAWAAPWLLKHRLGHLDPVRMVAEPDAVKSAIAQRPSLHRYVENVPRWVVSAAHRVLEDYDGDAASIWNDEPTATELRRRLEAFDGIGQKKAAMAVEILERDRGVVVRELDGSDVAFDVHIRRVFLRTGLADVDDLAHIVDQARLAHPDRPGAMDLPAWDIGRRWCRPGNPECDDCPLRAVCPRLVSRADDVR